jgi:PRC-barrel domain
MTRINSFVRGGLAFCLLAAGAGISQAQERIQRTERTETRSATQVRRVSTVIGANVTLEADVQAGKVVDFVINDDGCIDYMVVSFQERFVVVPWTVATFDFERRTVTINVTEERFRDAPSFTGNNWAEVSNAQFTERVRSFFAGRSERREQPGTRPTERRRRTEEQPQREPRAPRPGERGNPPERPSTNPPDRANPPQPGQPPRQTNPPRPPQRPEQPKDRGDDRRPPTGE